MPILIGTRDRVELSIWLGHNDSLSFMSWTMAGERPRQPNNRDFLARFYEKNEVMLHTKNHC